MARRRYSSETKAAVMAALLDGQSISEAAARYNVPAGTAKAWKAELTGSRSHGVLTEAEGKSVGELLMAYLRLNLATLAAQQEVFCDPDWLRQQGASDAAVLHGVLTDKAVRLLEALGNAEANAADKQ